jgi:hypothetical protein
LLFSQLFTRHILRLRNKVYAVSKYRSESRNDEIHEKYEKVIIQLESSIAVFEKENQLRPYCIFGVTATESLTLTIASAIGSFYFTLVSLFFAQSSALSNL